MSVYIILNVHTLPLHVHYNISLGTKIILFPDVTE